MLAVPILAGSASYAMAEACKCRVGLNLTLREGKCFYSVIMRVLLGSALNVLGVNPIKALVFSSVINGVCSIPLLYLLARIGRNSAIIGAYRSGWLSNLIVWTAFASISGATVAMFFAAMAGPSACPKAAFAHSSARRGSPERPSPRSLYSTPPCCGINMPEGVGMSKYEYAEEARDRRMGVGGAKGMLSQRQYQEEPDHREGTSSTEGRENAIHPSIEESDIETLKERIEELSL